MLRRPDDSPLCKERTYEKRRYIHATILILLRIIQSGCCEEVVCAFHALFGDILQSRHTGSLDIGTKEEIHSAECRMVVSRRSAEGVIQINDSLLVISCIST